MNIFSAFNRPGDGSLLDTSRQSLVRAAGHALSVVAPGTASRLAAWMWSSPPRTRRDGLMPEGAEPLALAVAGRVARGAIWCPHYWAGVRVLLQHGWGGSITKMNALVTALLEEGITVVAFDAFGHGATGTGRHGWRQSSLIEMSDLVVAANREVGPFDAVVAHSAGAAAVARALRQGMQVKRAVFIAPLVEPLSQAHVLSKALGLTSAVSARWPEVLLERFHATRSDIDMISPCDRAMPRTLIIQDQDDRFSQPEGARRLHRAWTGSELVETRGLGHVRIQHDADVVRRVAEFVAEKDLMPADHERAGLRNPRHGAV